MKLIRYARPETDLFGARFSDLMDEFFSDVVQNSRDSFVPSMDVSETETQFEVDVYLPGLRKEDIQIEMENGLLTVSGERKMEREEAGRKFHKVENLYGTFRRSLQLPDHIDHDSVHAAFKDGILRISVNKSEEKVRKQITIK